MTEHTGRFTGKVAEYAQYREQYDPEIVLPWLRQWCGLTPEWTVADIGAGTGMVGDLFRANGNRVLAIEPNAEMRAACAVTHAADDLFTVMDGLAENTGLADASVEAVAVGRALHWFHADSAFGEFRRILKPRGWVAILACGRTEDGCEENLAYKDFLAASAGRHPVHDPLLNVYRRLETFFAGGEFHHAEVAGEVRLDWAGLRGLTLSLSHAPMPGSAAYPALESALRLFFDRFAEDGHVTLTTRTWISAGRFAEEAS